MTDMVSEDGKRTEVLCAKVTEPMALDILRAAARDDRSVSDFIYRVLRAHLYGIVDRQDRAVTVNKV